MSDKQTQIDKEKRHHRLYISWHWPLYFSLELLPAVVIFGVS